MIPTLWDKCCCCKAANHCWSTLARSTSRYSPESDLFNTAVEVLVSNFSDGESVSFASRLLHMTAEPRSQRHTIHAEQTEKSTRSKWPECRRIADMPGASSSCLPRPLHMLHPAQTIDSLSSSPSFPHAFPLIGCESSFPRCGFDPEMCGRSPLTDGHLLCHQMTHNQLHRRFAVCQESGFARQGQAQLGCTVSHLFADLGNIMQKLNAARTRPKL